MHKRNIIFSLLLTFLQYCLAASTEENHPQLLVQLATKSILELVKIDTQVAPSNSQIIAELEKKISKRKLKTKSVVTILYWSILLQSDEALSLIKDAIYKVDLESSELNFSFSLASCDYVFVKAVMNYSLTEKSKNSSNWKLFFNLFISMDSQPEIQKELLMELMNKTFSKKYVRLLVAQMLQDDSVPYQKRYDTIFHIVNCKMLDAFKSDTQKVIELFEFAIVNHFGQLLFLLFEQAQPQSRTLENLFKMALKYANEGIIATFLSTYPDDFVRFFSHCVEMSDSKSEESNKLRSLSSLNLIVSFGQFQVTHQDFTMSLEEYFDQSFTSTIETKSTKFQTLLIIIDNYTTPVEFFIFLLKYGLQRQNLGPMYIYKVLKMWISLRREDFLDSNLDLLVRSFLIFDVASLGQWVDLDIFFPMLVKETVQPPQKLPITNSLFDYQFLFTFDEQAIVEHITVFEYALFQEIPLSHFFLKDNSESVELTRAIEWNNNIIHCFSLAILQNPKEVYSKLSNLAIKAQEIGNLQLVLEIEAALSKAPVSRLKLSTGRKKLIRSSEIQSLTCNQDNFKGYREYIRKNTPKLPFMNVLARDKTFIYDGNRAIIDGRWNLALVDLFEAQLQLLIDCKRQGIDVKTDRKLYEMISQFVRPIEEEELWKLSYSLIPPKSNANL